jgi:hypothetical protein
MDATGGVTPSSGTSQQDMTKVNQSIAFGIALDSLTHIVGEMVQADRKREELHKERMRETGES